MNMSGRTSAKTESLFFSTGRGRPDPACMFHELSSLHSPEDAAANKLFLVSVVREMDAVEYTSWGSLYFQKTHAPPMSQAYSTCLAERCMQNRWRFPPHASRRSLLSEIKALDRALLPHLMITGEEYRLLLSAFLQPVFISLGSCDLVATE